MALLWLSIVAALATTGSGAPGAFMQKAPLSTAQAVAEDEKTGTAEDKHGKELAKLGESVELAKKHDDKMSEEEKRGKPSPVKKAERNMKAERNLKAEEEDEKIETGQKKLSLLQKRPIRRPRPFRPHKSLASTHFAHRGMQFNRVGHGKMHVFHSQAEADSYRRMHHVASKPSFGNPMIGIMSAMVGDMVKANAMKKQQMAAPPPRAPKPMHHSESHHSESIHEEVHEEESEEQYVWTQEGIDTVNSKGIAGFLGNPTVGSAVTAHQEKLAKNYGKWDLALKEHWIEEKAAKAKAEDSEDSEDSEDADEDEDKEESAPVAHLAAHREGEPGDDELAQLFEEGMGDLDLGLDEEE